ncbi:uncharacterized protein BO96DRAFT_494227 [Aspergillus niger CBS 101883]|uniref:uncharacterized protein n=1 Tax=Aspergillus lacticoffeatus (strain CBS 101883) TaxID=1450533 RepID=UPI000D7FAB32|nr:uncharacterized protein BO96DRAFT_494227 [Aspergillus niger CBS 101883]PYH57850.1 hypothetical protein BO96DRAFT_494227 [Aspergillus niger CBS 101883]
MTSRVSKGCQLTGAATDPCISKKQHQHVLQRAAVVGQEDRDIAARGWREGVAQKGGCTADWMQWYLGVPRAGRWVNSGGSGCGWGGGSQAPSDPTRTSGLLVMVHMAYGRCELMAEAESTGFRADLSHCACASWAQKVVDVMQC